MVIDNKLIQEYERLLRGLIYKSPIMNKNDIDDVYSDIVIRILRSSEQYDSSKGGISTWLTYLARSEISNYIRKQVNSNDVMNRRGNTQYEEELTVSDDVEVPPLEFSIKEIIKNLKITDESKDIINYYLFKQMTTQEIASIVDVSQSSVARKVKLIRLLIIRELDLEHFE